MEVSCIFDRQNAHTKNPPEIAERDLFHAHNIHFTTYQSIRILWFCHRSVPLPLGFYCMGKLITYCKRLLDTRSWYFGRLDTGDNNLRNIFSEKSLLHNLPNIFLRIALDVGSYFQYKGNMVWSLSVHLSLSILSGWEYPPWKSGHTSSSKWCLRFWTNWHTIQWFTRSTCIIQIANQNLSIKHRAS
jgi:hypothetical protein